MEEPWTQIIIRFAASGYCLFISVMYPGVRRDYNFETTGRRTSMPCQPKSIMVVHSKPSGVEIRCESYVRDVSQ